MILKILGVIILFLMLIFLRKFIIGYYKHYNSFDGKIKVSFKDFLTYFKIEEENIEQRDEILKIIEGRNVKDEVVSSWRFPWEF